MGDAPIRAVVNLACAPPFECRAVVAARVEAEELAEQIADALALRVFREDNELSVQVIEPLELVTCAREVTRFGGSLRAFGATPGSLDLLRDADAAWRWICETLDLEARDHLRPFVATIEGGYYEPDELAAGFLERPVIALSEIPRRAPHRREPPEIFDEDDFTLGAMGFERDARAWHVRELYDRNLMLNHVRIRSLHRLSIGDRLTTYSTGYEVVAIL